MANLSNINNKFIVTDGGNGRVLIGATNDIGATLFANHPSTTAPSLTFNAPAGQVFENEDLQIAFGLNNASPYNGYMQTRFVSAPYYRNLAINPLGGNVGIGTNSPSYKLHVVGNINIQGTGGYLRWNSGDMAIVNAGGYAMAFETYTGSALTEKMRIDSSGNATFSGAPSGDNTIFIAGSRGAADNLPAGNITFRNVSNGVGDVDLTKIQSLTGTGSNQTQKGQLTFSTNDGTSLAERMRIDSSGNVGIGTTSPGTFYPGNHNLVVGDGNADSAITVYSNSANTGYLLFADDTSGSSSYTAQVRYNHSTNHMEFATNNSTSAKMTLDDNGNLGIGTTTFASTSNLQLKMGNMGSGIVGEIFDAVDNADNSRIIVCGGGTGTPQFSMRHYSAGYGIDMWLNTSSPWDTYIDNRNAASGFIFRNNCNNDGGEDELMRITGSGNVGIGGSPTVSFEIAKAGARMKMIDGTNQLNMGLWDGANYRFEGDANRPMFFTSYQGNINFGISGSTTINIQSANVGIGTTSPVSKLHVQSGDIGVTTDRKIGWIYNPGSDNNMYNYIKTADNGGVPASPLEISGSRWTNGNTRGIIFTHQTGGEIMTIMTGGNVGIGTTAPEHKLVAIGTIGFGLNYNGGVYVNNTITSVDENWGLEVQRTANVDDYNTRLKYYPVSGQSRAAGIYDSRNARFSLYSDTNNNPNIIIPNGNVGINNTSPGQKLSVVGDGSGTSDVVRITHGNGSHTGNGLSIRSANTGKPIYVDGSVGAGFAEITTAYNANPNIRTSGDVVAYASSDKRFKDNLEVIQNPIDKIHKLNGYTFDWNDKQDVYKGKDYGVVAQEVEKVMPELVDTRFDGYKAVKYEKLVPLLIESIKELEARVKELENK